MLGLPLSCCCRQGWKAQVLELLGLEAQFWALQGRTGEAARAVSRVEQNTELLGDEQCEGWPQCCELAFCYEGLIVRLSAATPRDSFPAAISNPPCLTVPRLTGVLSLEHASVYGWLRRFQPCSCCDHFRPGCEVAPLRDTAGWHTHGPAPAGLAPGPHAGLLTAWPAAPGRPQGETAPAAVHHH